MASFDNMKIRGTAPQLVRSINAALPVVIALILAVCFLFYLVSAWIWVTYPFSLEFTEGLVLEQAVRLAEGQNIYDSDLSTPPFTVANYGPVHPLLQTPFVHAFGPAFWYGRAISVLSTLVSALLIGLLIRKLSSDDLAALIGGLTFLATPIIGEWSHINRVDMTALVLSLAALYTVIRCSGETWCLVAAASLITLAIFTRQTSGLAAPLAIFVWLITRVSLRRAFLFGGLVAALSGAVLILLVLITDGGAWFHLFNVASHGFDISRLFSYLRDLIAMNRFLLIAIGLFVLFALIHRVKPLWMFVFYFAGAAIVSATIGKPGSNYNYFFELLAVFAIATGFLAAQRDKRTLFSGLLLTLILLQSGLYLNQTLARGLPDTSDWLAHDETLMQIVRETPGPILADEDMGLLVLAGRPIYIDAFATSVMAEHGGWDQTPFLDMLRQQDFALLLISGGLDGYTASTRWTKEMIQQMNDNYVLRDQVSGTYLYYPR